MGRVEELEHQVEVLQDRLSRMTEASVRINQSLDFELVLREVLRSACLLTNAKYGVIALLNSEGRLDEPVIHGLTPEQSRQLWRIPDRTKLGAYFTRLKEPLRVRDFSAHLRSMNLPPFAPPMALRESIPFLGAPLLHRDESVGNFFLAEKESSEEFTSEDEDILVMFASQATLVIANARRYREEQLVKERLATLIETSPVGVVVFDAKTGDPESFNREAVRIIENLRPTDTPPEELLKTLTIRRADGREVPLEAFPLIDALRTAETVRAEEITVEVPDGRSINTIVNATPVHSESGEIESVVITLQDMSRVDESERLRAEFLATVSHELRTPLSAIKGSVVTLLDPAVALEPAEVLQFHRIIEAQTDRMRDLIRDLLDVARIETATLPVYPEPAGVAALVDEARNVFLSSGGTHSIQIELAPDLPWVMADKMRIVQVLGNLLANAGRHSPESSTILVSAVHDGVHVAFSVADEGPGIPPASLPDLFRKFSRVEGEEQGGDTGLGLAICKGLVEAHGGRIWAESGGPGLGARITFTIPVAEQATRAGTPAPAEPPAASTARGETRILVVDDDPQVLRYARHALSMAGYVAIVTGEPKEALQRLVKEKPALILLDLMLPGTDGIELMKSMRELADVPVIFVSAYGQEEIIAKAFDQGAADYIVKPFSPTELAARIRAALREREVRDPPRPYTRDDLVVDYTEFSATLAGRPVGLTATEYRLLVELSMHAGRALTHSHLLQHVWGLEGGGDHRPVRTAIKSLRRKLGDDAGNPKYIFTEPRFGYRMVSGESPEPGDATPA